MDHKLKKYINNKLADNKWRPHKSPSKKQYDFLPYQLNKLTKIFPNPFISVRHARPHDEIYSAEKISNFIKN